MPLKNYTTQVPASRSIQEIQDSLVKHGAIGILLEYEKGTGRIDSLKFQLLLKDSKIPFRLPVDWRKFQAVLLEQGIKRARDDDYVYRVAWRCLRDWVLAQMALYETQMVDIQQVFLPYVLTKDGTSTLYERVLNNPKLLGSGNQDIQP